MAMSMPPTTGAYDSRAASSLHDAGRARAEAQASSMLEKRASTDRSRALRHIALALSRQRAFLRQQRVQARDEAASVQQDREALSHKDKKDWFPTAFLNDRSGPHRVRLNVGGQLFEVSTAVLGQDPDSLLAALCDPECPLLAQGEAQSGGARVVYVDRDWWVFRYVLIFMRDGLVPKSRALSLQLYAEAQFWKLGSLQRALEETHLGVQRTQISVDAKGGLTTTRPDEKSDWWKHLPNWWEAPKAGADDPMPERRQPEWWMQHEDAMIDGGGGAYDAEYGGRAYAPMSNRGDKVVTGRDDDDLAAMFQSTWHR